MAKPAVEPTSRVPEKAASVPIQKKTVNKVTRADLASITAIRLDEPVRVQVEHKGRTYVASLRAGLWRVHDDLALEVDPITKQIRRSTLLRLAEALKLIEG